MVHQDDFYKTDAEIPVTATGEQDWDCPEAIDFESFRKYLSEVKQGKITEIKSIETDPDLKLTSSEIASLAPRVPHHDYEIVFVEGFMLFHDTQVAEQFDISLFFYASYDTLRTRREARPGYVTAEGFWTDPPNYFRDIVWPAFCRTHEQFFLGEVGGTIKQDVLSGLNIKAFKNEVGTLLFDLVNWSLDQIAQLFKS